MTKKIAPLLLMIIACLLVEIAQGRAISSAKSLACDTLWLPIGQSLKDLSFDIVPRATLDTLQVIMVSRDDVILLPENCVHLLELPFGKAKKSRATLEMPLFKKPTKDALPVVNPLYLLAKIEALTEEDGSLVFIKE